MSHDTLIHRIVRPAVSALARTSVTPNQLTTLRLLTGLAAACGFAVGERLWSNLAAALFLISLLLDRADGELARQTGQSSAGGYRYDLVCDCVATTAAFLGMGMGLRDPFGMTSVLVGAVAGVGVAVVFWELNVVKLASVKSYQSVGGHVLIDADDAMILLPPMVWTGLTSWALLVAAVATPVIALLIWITGRRRAQPVGEG